MDFTRAGPPLTVERLDKPYSTVLNGAGSGQVSATVPWPQRWRVTAVATLSDVPTTTPYPVCQVYRGAVATANLIATTASGNRDVARGDEMFFSGETVTVAWVGGVPLSRITCNIIGEVER